MPDIIQDVAIAAAPERVYDAITRLAELARWWTSAVTAEPRVGSTAEFRFDKGATVFNVEMAVLDPAKRVRWIVRHGPPHWEGTTVSWDIAPAGSATETALRACRLRRG